MQITLPDDFVDLDEERDDYEMRATTAHGVVLATREVENDPEGNLDFWVDAIRNRLRRAGGYALLEEKEVTAGSGQRGKQLRFGRDERGQTFHYWITVFVTDSHVLVIEAGGRKELFEEAAERVERAIAGVQIG
jgi:hypothetical protein